MTLESSEVQCPYCGETVEIDIEPMPEEQSFVHDCTVCCHPIQIDVASEDDGSGVSASRSD